MWRWVCWCRVIECLRAVVPCLCIEGASEVIVWRTLSGFTPLHRCRNMEREVESKQLLGLTRLQRKSGGLVSSSLVGQSFGKRKLIFISFPSELTLTFFHFVFCQSKGGCTIIEMNTKWGVERVKQAQDFHPGDRCAVVKPRRKPWLYLLHCSNCSVTLFQVVIVLHYAVTLQLLSCYVVMLLCLVILLR